MLSYQIVSVFCNYVHQMFPVVARVVSKTMCRNFGPFLD